MLHMIFGTVLRMSIQGVIIFAVIFLIRFLLKKMHISHKYIVTLWVLFFFYLVFPWKLELPIGFWNADVFQWSDNSVVALDYDMTEAWNVADRMQAIKEMETMMIPEGYLELPPINSSEKTEYDGKPFASEESMNDNERAGSYVWDKGQQNDLFWKGVKAVSPYVWNVVGMALFAHFIWSYMAIQRKLSVCEKESDNIYYVQDIEVPMVFGIIKPRIYLPLNLDESNLFYVLSHERMHIKRGDQIFKILAYIVCMMHWFNPLVWLAYRILGNDIEKACDEAVIRGIGEEKKKDYANALLLAAEVKNGKEKRVFVAPICFDEGNVKSRIQNIVKYKYTLPIAGVVALGVAVVLGIVFMTKGSDETDIRNDEENIVAEKEGVENEPGYSDLPNDNTVVESEVITDPYYIDSETMRRVSFHDLLGYDGYFITKKDTTPMETTYYAVEDDETFIIASSWGFEREDYFIDIDGDGVRELICNVCYGDGGQDALIYRRYEDGIRVAPAGSLLDQEYDNIGVSSTVTWYDVTYDRIEIAYWIEEMQNYKHINYDLDLDAISIWYKPDFYCERDRGVYNLKSINIYEDDMPITVAARGKEYVQFNSYGVKEVDVYINDSLSQTITMEEAIGKDNATMIENGYTRCYEKDAVIDVVDINYDGYLDLQVYAWGTKDDSHYFYYCWNSEKNKFEYTF